VVLQSTDLGNFARASSAVFLLKARYRPDFDVDLATAVNVEVFPVPANALIFSD
jgi:hypothetical protein